MESVSGVMSFPPGLNRDTSRGSEWFHPSPINPPLVFHNDFRASSNDVTQLPLRLTTQGGFYAGSSCRTVRIVYSFWRKPRFKIGAGDDSDQPQGSLKHAG